MNSESKLLCPNFCVEFSPVNYSQRLNIDNPTKADKFIEKIYWGTRFIAHPNIDKIPRTHICSHDGSCQFDAEFLYAIAVHVENGIVSQGAVRAAFNEAKNLIKEEKQNALCSNECSGFKMDVKDLCTSNGKRLQSGIHYDPTNCLPYTKLCDGDCDLTAPTKFALYYLIATKTIGEKILKSICDHGWIKRMSKYTLINNRKKQISKELERPKEFPNWIWHPSETKNFVDYLIWEKEGKFIREIICCINYYLFIY